MRLQEKQKYCFLLEINGADYSKAFIHAVFYEKNVDGLWKEIEIASDKLDKVDIIDNKLCFNGISVERLLDVSKEKFEMEQKSVREWRIEEARLREERYKQVVAEKEKKRKEIEQQREEYEKKLRQQREEYEKKLRQQKEDAERRRVELEEKRRLDAEREQEEKRKREEDFKRNMDSNFSQQETQVRDADGNRWIKCEFCGKIAKEREFTIYGGSGHINLGTCKYCSEHNLAVKEKVLRDMPTIRKKCDPTACPDCGGKLRERSGPYGRFYGCTNYPKCRYSRPIRK
jgi:hypothetical protein